MRRLKTLTGLTAALAALALGGSAIATAAQGTSAGAAAKKHVKHATKEKTSGPDADAIQSGDQTGKDVSGKASSAGASETGTPEAATENTESSAPSDGPGGHEDPEGAEVENTE